MNNLVFGFMTNDGTVHDDQLLALSFDTWSLSYNNMTARSYDEWKVWRLNIVIDEMLEGRHFSELSDDEIARLNYRKKAQGLVQKRLEHYEKEH